MLVPSRFAAADVADEVTTCPSRHGYVLATWRIPRKGELCHAVLSWVGSRAKGTACSRSLSVAEPGLNFLGHLTTKVTTYETDNGGQTGTTGEGASSDVRQCIPADVHGPALRDWKSCSSFIFYAIASPDRVQVFMPRASVRSIVKQKTAPKQFAIWEP